MFKQFNKLFDSISIKFKILIHFIFIAIFSMCLTYMITYDSLEEEIQETYFKKLTAIREIKKTQIEEYIRSIKNDIFILARTPFVVTATEELSNNFMKNDFSSIVKKYDKEFLKYIDKKEFYDIFLIDIKTNNIIYTVAKESDFTTNIKKGKYKDTNLARLYKTIKNTKKKDDINIIDFEHYAPSGGQPASFIATKIINEKNEIISIIVIQIPINKINNIMTGNQNWENEGFGKTGEAYLIAQDCMMRNDSRFFIEDKINYFKQIKNRGVNKERIQEIRKNKTTVLFQEVKGPICNNILDIQNGIDIIKDYRGVEVLSSFTPLDIKGLKWIIVSEIDKKEAFSYINTIQNKILLLLVLIFVIIIFTSMVFSRTITKPISVLILAVKNLGTGDLTKRVDIKCNDELGELATSFNNSLDKLEKITYSVEHFTKLSMTDNLTQIHNRLKLNHELDIEIIRTKRTNSNLTLVMFDIDHFKKINDTYGHDIGDVSLIGLVNIINQNIRKTDVFARWGGEEFMILLLDTNLENSILMVEKIRIKIEENNFETINHMTCSFGITQFKQEDTKEILIKKVDEVLYEAKHKGRNRIESK